MSDDIVERLRKAKTINWGHYSAPPMGPLFDDALHHIEVLNRALALACGELSGYGPHTNESPHHLMKELLKEANQ